MFKGKKGAALASSIGKRSKTFVPGAADLEKPAQTKHDKEREAAIKVDYTTLAGSTATTYARQFICASIIYHVCLQKAIASAKTLSEVEKLQAMLAVNQIPGHTNGQVAAGKYFTCTIVTPIYLFPLYSLMYRMCINVFSLSAR